MAVALALVVSTMVSAIFPSASMVWPGPQSLSAGVAVNAAVNVHNRGSSDYSEYRVSAGHSHGPPTAVNVQFCHEQTYYVIAGETPVLVHNCGDVELGPGIDSADALTSFRSPKPESEFVFDPETGRFLAGDRTPIPDGLSPHQQLQTQLGADPTRVVGGTLFRDADGGLVFTQNSGHFGTNWTDTT